MAAQSKLRVYTSRILGRTPPDEPDRIVSVARSVAELETRVNAMALQLGAMETALGHMHDTLAAADPQLCRDVVDSLRDDVRDLVVRVNGVLLHRADQG